MSFWPWSHWWTGDLFLEFYLKKAFDLPCGRCVDSTFKIKAHKVYHHQKTKLNFSQMKWPEGLNLETPWFDPLMNKSRLLYRSAACCFLHCDALAALDFALVAGVGDADESTLVFLCKCAILFSRQPRLLDIIEWPMKVVQNPRLLSQNWFEKVAKMQISL